ncbi:MAG: thioredoxin [Spirochaetaceae bacterium]|nr:thioredoxin [Spirochaetaceae bacterium]
MIEHLTKDSFIEKVFDFTVQKEWSYKGDKPAIVDFYADWCGPCKMLAPTLEAIAKDYDDSLNVYKVNTDQEQELSAAFGIQSIPSLLFIPVQGMPQMAQGALPRSSLESAIKDVLGVNPAAK